MSVNFHTYFCYPLALGSPMGLTLAQTVNIIFYYVSWCLRCSWLIFSLPDYILDSFSRLADFTFRAQVDWALRILEKYSSPKKKLERFQLFYIFKSDFNKVTIPSLIPGHVFRIVNLSLSVSLMISKSQSNIAIFLGKKWKLLKKWKHLKKNVNFWKNENFWKQ